MRKVIDSDLASRTPGHKKNYLQIIVNIYAILLSIFLIVLLSSLNIKTEPSPLETTDVLEIQSSYSMLAGLCINVGDCGNDQIVLGLKKNAISKQFYQYLVWKKTASPGN